MSALDPTQAESDAARATIAQTMPALVGAWLRIYPSVQRVVEAGLLITPDEWADNPQAREHYEVIKAIYYAAETAKGADA